MILNHSHCGVSAARRPFVLGGEMQSCFMGAVRAALRRSGSAPEQCCVPYRNAVLCRMLCAVSVLFARPAVLLPLPSC